ncbi:hypothetical protein CP993_25890, partial [Escherichia coli]
IVPLTILLTLLIMRSLGIELHSVSMAAIIIALGTAGGQRPGGGQHRAADDSPHAAHHAQPGD